MSRINNPYKHIVDDEYLFEVEGVVKVNADDVEEAKLMAEEDIKELLYQAFLDGNLTIGDVDNDTKH